MQGIKRGIFSAEDLQKREQKALAALRKFDSGSGKATEALDAVMDYQQFLTLGDDLPIEQHEKELNKMRTLVERTLDEAPWKRCRCSICSKAGVEVIIFRSSNRNKRRGFHNLGVYHKHVQRTLENHR